MLLTCRQLVASKQDYEQWRTVRLTCPGVDRDIDQIDEITQIVEKEPGAGPIILEFPESGSTNDHEQIVEYRERDHD